jgi:hypothetical protein
MPNQMNDDLPARIADNTGYIFIFYLVKLLLNKLIDEDYFQNREQIAQWIMNATRFLIKTYDWIFKTQCVIEAVLLCVTAYQHTLEPQ